MSKFGGLTLLETNSEDFFKKHHYLVKTSVAALGATLEKFGLLVILIVGRTDGCTWLVKCI